MPSNSWTRKIALCFLFLSSIIVQAGTPLWSFEALTVTSLTQGVVQYQVTSQTSKPHTLTVLPIEGVSQVIGTGLCTSPFVFQGKGATCTLSLAVDGRLLSRSSTGGPVVCQQGATNMCYQPGIANSLHVNPFRIHPSSGPAAGYTSVTIVGLGFIGTSSVTFDKVNAIGFNVVSDTTITAVTPPHAVGSVDVEIKTASGSKMRSDAYTYVANVEGEATAGGLMGCLSNGTPTLIAAASDGASTVEWIGDTAASVGFTGANSETKGLLNTQIIVSLFSNLVPPSTISSYAAGLCSTYSIDSGGNSPCVAGNVCYDNWFLPAVDQLVCLCPLISGTYWSSTENEANAGMAISVIGFPNCVSGAEPKDDPRLYRCAQAYPPSTS
jgi:hypothetical protein